MKYSSIMVAAAAIMAVTGPVAAQQLGANPNAKSQGSNIGVFSSQVTGNGVVVREQAQTGTRSELVQGILAAEGRGRNASDGGMTGSQLGLNPNANAQGSTVGEFSSQVTGNGAVVSEQAQSGMRAGEVQGIQAADGRGRDAVKE